MNIIEASIKTINIDNRFRKDFGDIESLASSIEEMGLLQPIGIDSNYNLIFGGRRIEAFKLLERDAIPARIIHVDSLLKAERDENELHKGFSVEERVAIGRAIEAELGNRQGQRTDLGGTGHPVSGREVVQGEETGAVAAEIARFGSEPSYRRAKSVIDNGVPELIDAVNKEEITITEGAEISGLSLEDQKTVVSMPEKKARKEKITKIKLEIPPSMPPRMYNICHIIDHTVSDIERLFGSMSASEIEQLSDEFETEFLWSSKYKRKGIEGVVAGIDSIVLVNRFFNALYKVWRSKNEIKSVG